MCRAKKAAMLACILVASACSTSSNIPVAYNFPAASDRPLTASVFFDQNGTIYPDQWQSHVKPEEAKLYGSLLNATIARPDLAAWLAKGEADQLRALQRLIESKRRIVILTHGYNNDSSAAGQAFDLLESRIAWKPEDLIIRVYWDGFLGSYGGQAKVWFRAAASSQLVGSRGLRRVLNLTGGKKVVLISHSRGASVLLSALSNPTYSWSFRSGMTRTDFGSDPKFLRPDPLAAEPAEIRLIMLAPAVGYPDFWSAQCEQQSRGAKHCNDPAPRVSTDAVGSKCPETRSFPPRLKSIYYTLNDGDKILGKAGFGLARYYNATDLGHKPEVGKRLEQCYSFDFKPTKIDRRDGHGFFLYAQDPKLSDMLTAAGIEVKH